MIADDHKMVRQGLKQLLEMDWICKKKQNRPGIYRGGGIQPMNMAQI